MDNFLIFFSLDFLILILLFLEEILQLAEKLS